MMLDKKSVSDKKLLYQGKSLFRGTLFRGSKKKSNCKLFESP